MRLRRALLVLAGAALLLGLGGGLFVGCSLADIRPDNLRDHAALPDDLAQQGRERLAQLEAAHGTRAAWVSRPAVEVTLEDAWPGFLTRTAAMPWDTSPAQLRMTIAPTADNARIAILDGDDAGWAWGVQQWATYRVDPQGAVTFEPHEDAWFYVPTLAYFFEAAMRLSEGQYIAYGGQQERGGVTYDRVYITWGSVEPRDDIDQYVAWIDAETHRLAFLEFTVRDLFGFFTSAAIYEGWREVDGLLVPGVITIVSSLDDPDDVVHRMTIQDVRFGDVPPEVLLPDPARRARKEDHGASR